MAIAADLPEAAGLAYDNLYVKALLGPQLQAALITFLNQATPSFPESAPNNHPISNWLTVINAFYSDNQPFTGITSPGGSLDQLNTIAQLIYRICWCGDALEDAGLITGTQATALLTAYNNAFA